MIFFFPQNFTEYTCETTAGNREKSEEKKSISNRNMKRQKQTLINIRMLNQP